MIPIIYSVRFPPTKPQEEDLNTEQSMPLSFTYPALIIIPYCSQLPLNHPCAAWKQRISKARKETASLSFEDHSRFSQKEIKLLPALQDLQREL